MSKVLIALSLAAMTGAAPLPEALFSGPPTQTVVSTRVDSGPQIDGDLSDACWQQAGRVTAFRRVQSTDAAAERTAVMFVHDATALYVAAVVADPTVTTVETTRDAPVWQDDCVEIFLDPERSRQDRFHFIVSAVAALYDANLGDGKWNADPDLQRAARPVDGGWVVELAIPYAAVGAAVPFTGEVWDLKLTREDYSKAGGLPLLSSWQFSGASFHEMGGFGQLVFDAANTSVNGDFAKGLGSKQWLDGSMWRLSRGDDHDSQLTLTAASGRQAPPCGLVDVAQYAQLQHIARAKPYRNYRLSAWVNLDGLTAARRLSMQTEPYARVAADASKRGWQQLVTYDTSRADWLVLTFTASGSHGSYLIDDVEIVEIDNIPRDADAVCLTGNAVGAQAVHNHQLAGSYTYYELGSNAPYFPQGQQRGVPDVRRFSGWIPFAEGHLTDGKPSYVQYQHWSKDPGKTIVFDLGRDCYLTDVEIEPVLRQLTDARLYLRAADAPSYKLVAIQRGRHGLTQFKSLDAQARWVRLDATGECGYREVRIWGKQADGKAPIAAYAAPVLTTAEAGRGGPALAARSWSVFPTPKQLTSDGGIVALPAAPGIAVTAATPRLTWIAEDLAAQLRLSAGVEAILRDDEPFITLTLTTTPGDRENGPEGYVLEIGSDGVSIVGGDADGLFYGCQTLLQCLSAERGLRQLEIRDWPRYPLRMLQMWSRDLLKPDNYRSVEAMARFRMNQLLVMGRDPQVLPLARDLARLGMDAVPVCAAMPGGNWYRGCVELNPGETEADLPDRARINPCPSNPLTKQRLAAEIAAAAEYPGQYAYINCDEMYQEHKGARWNVCDLCTARKMTGTDLFVELLESIYNGLAAVGKKPMMLDTMLHIPYRGMDQAFARLPRDIPIGIWHPRVQEKCRELGFPVWEFCDGDTWTIDEQSPETVGALVPGDGGFKLDRAAIFAEMLWSGRTLALDDPQVLRQMSDAMAMVHETVLATPLPSRRAAAADCTPIDLAPAANVSLADTTAGDGAGLFDLGPGGDLAFMRGDVVLNEIPFQLGDLVVVDNRQALDARQPAAVRLPLARRAASLIFLQTMTVPLPWTYSSQVKYAGTYLIDYSDDTRVAFPIRYKHNILEYDTLRETVGTYKSALVTVPEATPAWRGRLPNGDPLLLLAAEWVNPFPEKEIAAVTMRAGSRALGTRIALFALTAIGATPRDVAIWSHRERESMRIPSATVDTTGLTELDLSGGRFISNTEYLAPDQTRITASRCYTLEGATLVAEMSVGLVTVDNNQGWQAVRERQPEKLTVRFPQPRRITAVSLLGLPETPEYVFGEASPVTYTINVQRPDETWFEVGHAESYLADRDWQQTHVFPEQSVAAVEIIMNGVDGKACRVYGIARLRLFE